jgi:diaminopropionate ammonia-lyase
MKDYFINKPCNEIPECLTVKMLLKEDAFEYHSSLEGYLPTPLVCLDGMAEKYGVDAIFVKDESYRFGLDAFKVLGASWAVKHLLDEKPGIKTFCTATEGNHGRAELRNSFTDCMGYNQKRHGCIYESKG